MSIHVKNGGSWALANTIFVKSSGSWKRAKEVWVKNNGEWKMAHLKELNINISQDTAEYNIEAAAISAGWDKVTPLFANVVIQPGVVVHGSNPNNDLSFAMTTGYNWPLGSYVEIHNSGFIIGRGGDGGNGGSYTFIFIDSYAPSAGRPGEKGGTALIAGVPTIMYNYGTIAGGGGGGGGGGGLASDPGTFGFANVAGGSGGGGGRSGAIVSTGGTGGAGIGSGGSNGGNGGNGGNGTFAAAGLGSTINYNGGNGGTWGAAGTAGQGGGSGGAAGGTPGPAGLYVVGLGNVSFANIGTRLGGTA